MASLPKVISIAGLRASCALPGTGINRGGLKPIEEQMTGPRIIIDGSGFGGAAGISELAP